MSKQHSTEHMCSLLDLIDIKNYSTKMEFPFDENKYNYAQEFISKLPKKNGLIALNVDASNTKSILGKEQIIKFANSLRGGSILLLFYHYHLGKMR